ncbi:uncharacterized protein KY384_000463 [Bacidia gigantensis]|uniref:uncharacterized protein n=1 Tax=Bacidia gigantensis TaxID=2732470 RepID=UPI001D03DFE8|nr:uncharacterized protein KY384_000463 [Bacidia gigantensis]KAG8525703.1 hypothetical protein KY384_000463 [Bacidia gigantensis]
MEEAATIMIVDAAADAGVEEEAYLITVLNKVRYSVIQSWQEKGREGIVTKGVEAQSAQDIVLLAELFQELIRSSVDSRLESHETGTVVNEIAKPASADQDSAEMIQDEDLLDASSLFLDTLSVFVEASSFSSSMRTLLHASGIPAPKIRRELDTPLLESLGLIRSTFTKMGIRQQTNRLYRQSNYNLLREETEGYSKLITEFFTTSNNEPPTSEVVEDTFERVKGMIGAFDLDVGRVLDITLDVFAAVLVKQYRFFVKYLRASSWWPSDAMVEDSDARHVLGPLPRWALPGCEGRVLNEEEREEATRLKDERDILFWRRCKEVGLAAFFELGGRCKHQDDIQSAQDKSKDNIVSGFDADQHWIETTRTSPPVGNKVAAQVLGFKLRFYNSNARDTSDTFAINLIYLASLLIKIGFISLKDLYPHIWPEDQAMDSVREDKLKEKAEKEKANRPGGGTNALLMAAPLPDDTIEALPREAARLREAEAARRQQKLDLTTGRSTPSVQPEEKTADLPEPAEQKVQLLKSLLCIGALPEALYMMGRFPWLPDAFSELPEYIHRILHHCLSKVWEPLRPLKDEGTLRAQQRFPDTEQGGVPKGQVRLIEAPARRTLRWAQLDKDDTTEAVDYRFYWDDWADIIPVCQNVDDVFMLCSTLLNYSGVKIGQDPSLLLKLVRIGSYSLSADASEENFARWTDLSKRLLLPALSMTKCNPSIANEMFEMLKCFPESTRYNLYAEWNFGQISRLPDVKAAFEQTKAETRDILKRISNTTVRPMARALAKVAYSSPGIVFSVAIGQLEAYENIVDTFVECGRYFTFLAYDVLTWSLMNSLSGQGRDSLQADGILTSKWLAALSLFAGKVFKKYSIMNPLPVIQYVEHQLRQGNPTHLIVLEEVTRSMAGIMSDVSFTEAQIIALNCGKILRAQMLQQLQDERHKKEFEKSAKRITKPLVDSRLAGKLLISLAQERQTCIFRVEENNAHPKLLGNVFDQINRVFGQYLDFLRAYLSVKEFDQHVPEVGELVNEFGLEPGVAFWISRATINANIDEYEAAHRKSLSATKKPEVDGVSNSQPDLTRQNSDMAVDVKEATVKESDSMEITTTSAETAVTDTQQEPAPQDAMIEADPTRSEPPPSSKADLAPLACHPKLQLIAESLQKAIPIEVWQVLSPAFYVTFWHLALGDIINAGTAYTDESKRIQDQIKAIGADRTDVSIAGTKRKKDEQETLTDLNTALTAEMKDYVYLKHLPRLRKEKNHWFTGLWGRYDDVHVTLIERCFFPRLTLSPTDAYFTFRMIKWLHKEGAASFKTMGVYDKFFDRGRLTSMIFLCSAKEAECLGRFINDVLRDLGSWHKSRSTYEKEAFGPKKTLLGFSKVRRDEQGKEVPDFVDYEDFRRLLMKWHRLLNAALKACYASGEYMHIRNAITILNIVFAQFPVVDWMGKNQREGLAALLKSEPREDLKIAMTSVLGLLRKGEKREVMPQAFCLAPDNGKAGGSGVRANSVRPNTPQPNNGGSKTLNPSAPAFRPSPQPVTNGDPTSSKPMPGKVDAEDGEIDDAQVKNASEKVETNTSQLDKPDNTTQQQAQPAPKRLPDSLPKADPPQNPSITSRSGSVNSASNVKAPEVAQLSKPPSIPDRPEPRRPTSSTPLNGHADLPSKPDPSQYRHGDSRVPQKVDERPPLHARDTRIGGRAGLEGAKDLPNARAPERPQLLQPPRDVAQGNNRIGRSGPDDGYGRYPPRDTRAPLSDDRSSRLQNSRSFPESEHGGRDFNPGQRGRESAAIPPTGNIPAHPDREALIHGPSDSERERHPRYPSERQNHSGPERRSRHSSPLRSDGRGPINDSNRQSSDSRYQYEDRPAYGHYEEPSAPTGPRSGRGPMGPPSTSSDRFRDTMRPQPTPGSLADPNVGRLRHDAQNNRQSESYGRLNAESDVPSGPKLSSGSAQPTSRNGRNVSAPQLSTSAPHVGGTSQPPLSLQTARQAPNGPASSGPALRSSPRNQSHGQSSNASGQGENQTSEIAGIHPDRLKAIQGVGPQATRPAPVGRGGGQAPPSPSSTLPTETPRGPNNQSNAGPPPARNAGPPTGPADRRSDKRFTGLQSVLQQSNGQPLAERVTQGTNIRGRGGRVNTAASPSTSGPPTPINQSYSQRDEPFESRANGSFRGPMQGDDSSYGRNTRHEPAGDERRSARHRSRSPGNKSFDYGSRQGQSGLPPRGDARERFGTDGPSMNIRGNAEADFRSGPPLAAERDHRGSRRGGREDQSDRRDGQDWRAGPGPGPGRRGDEREGRDGGGSLRKRGRADEGFVDRNMDSKRPRR